MAKNSTWPVLILIVIVDAVMAGSLDFPPGFKFGAASSSYQVEGAWNVSDKGKSNWDEYTHKPGTTADGSTGDVACDSYHQWRRDVEMAKELGLDFYRFSISWTRLLPTGLPNKISEDGRRYYDHLINGLLAEGIEPLISINHMDIPLRFELMGGWTNPNMADWFGDFARVVFNLYADRVKTWITINEPVINCALGYGAGILAPGVNDQKLAMYHCYKNTLLAHAKAWRVYDEEFKPRYHGKAAIVNQLLWFQPMSEGDADLTELTHQYINDICSHPIYSVEGGWPPEVEALIFHKSKMEGLARSRLPAFTDEEIDLVRGTYDFYALNFYTSRLVRSLKPGESILAFPMDGAPEIEAAFDSDPQWEDGASFWFKVYPEGLRKQLNWIKEKCNNPEIIITENGISTLKKRVEDQERIRFFKNHLYQVLLAIADGVNVTGYTAWSLMDSFEWVDGYSVEFGLFSVDFQSPTKERIPKKSAKYYSKVISARSLNISSSLGHMTSAANKIVPAFGVCN